MPEVAPIVTYEDFSKIDLRVATVISCEKHPNGDKLYVMKLDAGELGERTICAGLREAFPDPTVFVGKQIIIVANLQERTMRGIQSQGMLLAVGDKQTGKLQVATFESPVTPGSQVK